MFPTANERSPPKVRRAGTRSLEDGMSRSAKGVRAWGAGAAALTLAAACSPTVRVMAPTEPIEINLNINITQDIRVRMDREIEDLISENPDLF